MRHGDSEPKVTHLQELLRKHGYDVAIDGYFGPQLESMVRSFQRSSGLVADGVVGPTTWKALEAISAPEEPGTVEPAPQPEPEPVPAGSRPTLCQGDRGDDIRDLQVLLQGAGYSVVADGVFGAFTASVVRQLQRSFGLVADGVVGPDTWNALEYQPALG